MTHTSSLPSSIEPLENRIALSATSLAVARALDLDDSISVVLSGNGLQFATQSLGATGQLLGFPSGGDSDFLILSTGIASHVTTLQNSGPNQDHQGTDLGGVGPDEASVSFTLPVPEGASQQRLKIDFVFLTEEYPEFVGSEEFNDTFEIFINGVDYAQDEFGSPMEVDHAFFSGEPAPGTFFDGRTNKLTLTYAVPEGVTSLNVELRLRDEGDGELDSAVIVDNVRFESPQVVYVDFDGGAISGHFGSGITAILPAFDAADLGSIETTDALISQLMMKLQEKFSLYDVVFTSTLPTQGDFTTLMVGGDNELVLDISGASPLLQRQHQGSVTLAELFGLGSDSMLGFAGAPDVGNVDRNDRAVVFSGEFDDFFSSLTPGERLEHLVITLAHELGHNLGLRHVLDAATADIMKQTAPRAINAVFGSALISLAEEWSDGVTLQNDHSYLTSVLGRANASGLSESVTQNVISFSTLGLDTLFDVTITIVGNDPDAAPITLHFDELDGSQNIQLPTLPAGAQIAISASSSEGGPLDVFSGVPQAGEITSEENTVPLFDSNGNLMNIPLSKGALGSLVMHGSLSLQQNELGNVTVMQRRFATFTDSDGDIYTVRLSGPGLMGYVFNDPDQDGKGGLLKLVVDNTTVGESILTITVKKARFGDGQVNIGEITGSLGSGLKTLSAPGVNLDGGGIIFSGALGTVVARDLINGADLVGGVGAGVKTNVTLHVIGDASDIGLGTAVGTFKAARVGEAGITLASLEKLIVSGDREANIAGDIAGNFQITGLLGRVKARDLLPNASIEAGGTALDRTVLALHEIMDGASLSFASLVSSLKAARVGDAQISGHQFDVIRISGDNRNYIPGDFGGDLLVTNKIGKFTARDLLSTASIFAGGSVFDVVAFTAHAIHDGVTIAMDSSVSTFRAAYVGDAQIQVAAIGSLLITGDPNAWLAGDFKGTLTVAGGEDFISNGIGSARIAGNVVDAKITAESIGTFKAKGVMESEIFASFVQAAPEDPWGGGVFFEGGTIKSFVVGRNGFSDSIVAARSIGTISMAGIVPDNGGDPFGFLIGSVPSKVAITGFTYVKNGPTDQSLSDFHVKVV